MFFCAPSEAKPETALLAYFVTAIETPSGEHSPGLSFMCVDLREMRAGWNTDSRLEIGQHMHQGQPARGSYHIQITINCDW